MLMTRAPTLALGSFQRQSAAGRCQAFSQPFRTHFLGRSVSAATLHCNFAGLSLRSQGEVRAPGRGSMLVEANSKTGLGITKRGSRRARTRTSGFRARTQTPNGRLVLKARRKKGRKTLCPANNYRK